MKKSDARVWSSLMMMVLVLFGTAARAAEPAKAAGVLRLTGDTPWVLSSDEPEALQRALADVKADWRRVFGHVPLVVTNLPASWSGPAVYLGWKAPWLKELVKGPFPGRESFVLRAQPDASGRLALVATGADLRGSIYAAYALSEEILGVDPWYYWTDHPPVGRDQIEVPAGFNQRVGPPTFKYRGWFINDEDLLGGYAPDPLRENVFSLEMWDRVCEVLLRLRGNLLVPGTFTFPDERAQELASRRGLVLNMHHILVVGLNTYRWPKDVPFSYAKHPGIMERYWQTCIDAFKDQEVVWTVGYRGKHDRPFWKDEPELTTPEQRGALISRAIARQVELIRKAQPHAAIIANMWMEGADLLQAGLLKLPKGVTVVWPDDGTGLIRDKGRVQAGQGIYYHTAMLNRNANQLSELVNPGRIYGEVGRFARAGATEFFLVNVSDVRPVPLSTECAMRLVWNAAPYLQRDDQTNMDEWLTGWSRRQFGPQAAKEVASLYRQYFDIPYMRHATRLGDNTLHYRLQRLDAAADAALTKGKPLSKDVQTQITNNLNLTAANRKPLADLLARAETVAAIIPGERKPFYQAHVLTPIHIHHDSCTMLETFATGLKEWGDAHQSQALTQLEQAWRASDSLFAALRQAEYGKWDNWYLGERFVGVEFSRDCVRRRLAQLRGEPVPPTRKQRGYPELYDYQVPFEHNFPLLYPPGPARTPPTHGDSPREATPKIK